MTTALKEITAQKAVELLDECVSIRGAEYVYQPPSDDCQYVHKDEEDPQILSAGCIVGMALNRHGASLSDLVSCEGLEAKTLPEGLFPMTVGARNVFTAAQVMQDGGHTWGEALEAGKAVSQHEG